MPVSFDKNIALRHFKSSGGSTKFPDSLKRVLEYSQNDPNIKDIQSVAYLLATAKAESDYSLSRWESDYLCGQKGVPYRNKPCDKALSYYQSSSGKRNYYQMGTDRKGLPYFGRGLIQLTGKSNYDKYGKMINVDLVADGDKALLPKNSYKIASAYLNKPKGSSKKSVFDSVREGDLKSARKKVNGGIKGLDRVNSEYKRWLNVLKQSNFKTVAVTKNEKRLIIGAVVLSALVGGYLLLKR